MSKLSLIVALLAAAAFPACSDKQAPGAPASVKTLHEAPTPVEASSPTDEADDSLSASLNAAGIAVKYRAHFDGAKLTRIEETRTVDSRRGEYEFYGARLVKYSGAAFTSTATLLLEFDMQGAVKSAQATPAPLAESEIGIVRQRASLLRSHALAQRSTRMHSK